MPGMSGYELCRILKKTAGMSEIPVIVVSASGLDSDVEEISTFSEGYLRKPVDKATLINEMMKFLPYHYKDKMSDTSADDVIEISQEQLDELFKVIEEKKLIEHMKSGFFQICPQAELVKYSREYIYAVQVYDTKRSARLLGGFAELIQSLKVIKR